MKDPDFKKLVKKRTAEKKKETKTEYKEPEDVYTDDGYPFDKYFDGDTNKLKRMDPNERAKIHSIIDRYFPDNGLELFGAKIKVKKYFRVGTKYINDGVFAEYFSTRVILYIESINGKKIEVENERWSWADSNWLDADFYPFGYSNGEERTVWSIPFKYGGKFGSYTPPKEYAKVVESLNNEIKKIYQKIVKEAGYTHTKS